MHALHHQHWNGFSWAGVHTNELDNVRMAEASVLKTFVDESSFDCFLVFGRGRKEDIVKFLSCTSKTRQKASLICTCFTSNFKAKAQMPTSIH